MSPEFEYLWTSTLSAFTGFVFFQNVAENSNPSHCLKGFLENICKTINEPGEAPDFEVELAKERLGEVKNRVIEGLKGRWIKPQGRERRESVGSFVSTKSKRDRESLETDMRYSKPRVASPTKPLA